MELKVAPPERRGLGAPEQAVPHHLQEAQDLPTLGTYT